MNLTGIFNDAYTRFQTMIGIGKKPVVAHGGQSVKPAEAGTGAPAGTAARADSAADQVSAHSTDRTGLSQGATVSPKAAAKVSMFADEPLQQVSDPAEARRLLTDKGFIQGKGYRYAALADLDAATLRHLCRMFSAETGRDNSSMLFALGVAGAVLNQPAERQDFIKSNLLGRDAGKQLYQMSFILKHQPDPALASALQHSLAQAGDKQIVAFLYKSGFLASDRQDDFGPGMKPQTVAHLPRPVLDTMIQTLDQRLFKPYTPIVGALKQLR